MYRTGMKTVDEEILHKVVVINNNFLLHYSNIYATAWQTCCLSGADISPSVGNGMYIFADEMLHYKSHRWSNTLQVSKQRSDTSRHALNTEQYFGCRCWANGCLWLHRQIRDCRIGTVQSLQRYLHPIKGNHTCSTYTTGLDWYIL